MRKIPLWLIVLLIALVVILTLPGTRYAYYPRTVPDSSVIVFYRLDRLNGAVQRFDYPTGRWHGYPAPATP